MYAHNVLFIEGSAVARTVNVITDLFFGLLIYEQNFEPIIKILKKHMRMLFFEFSNRRP